MIQGFTNMKSISQVSGGSRFLRHMIVFDATKVLHFQIVFIIKTAHLSLFLQLKMKGPSTCQKLTCQYIYSQKICNSQFYTTCSPSTCYEMNSILIILTPLVLTQTLWFRYEFPTFISQTVQVKKVHLQSPILFVCIHNQT